jgi:hypothetical protein
VKKEPEREDEEKRDKREKRKRDIDIERGGTGDILNGSNNLTRQLLDSSN